MFQRFISLTAFTLGCLCAGMAAEPVAGYLRDSIPGYWSYTPEKQMDAPDATDGWWRGFNDSLLDSLINAGIENNYNVLMAMRRAGIARATMMQARAQWFPTVSADLSWNKSHQSGATTVPTEPGEGVSYFSAGLSAQWEIDIFGKIASGVKARKADYMASRAEYAGAMVSVCAQIADTYIQLREYQQQLAVAERHSENQMKIVEIAKARFETTLASKLDVAQALETYYSTTASIPMLHNSIQKTINALAVLTGIPLDRAKALLSSPGQLPEYLRAVSAGIPADLLRRRPAIAEAEMQLAADAAQVGIAKKDFLPTLSIAGSIGTEAHRAGDLFSGDSFTWSVVPTLSWTVFDGLSRKYSLAAARQTMQAAIDNYNLAVQTAVQETDNALSTYTHSLLYVDAIQKVIEQNNEELSLAVQRYKNSLSPMSDVVNALLRSLAAENSLITAKGQALSALVQLYEALGGGFDAADLAGDGSPLPGIPAQTR